MMKKIQIHYREPDGKTGVINYLSSENAEASLNEATRNRLREKASKMAGEWSKIYPTTTFTVVEV